jgi:hypothetical protein
MEPTIEAVRSHGASTSDDGRRLAGSTNRTQEIGSIRSSATRASPTRATTTPATTAPSNGVNGSAPDPKRPVTKVAAGQIPEVTRRKTSVS